MKGKIVGLVLAVLLVCFVFPGCSAGQIDELESQIATLQDDKAVVEAERDELDSNLEKKDVDISKLEEEKAELLTKIEYLEEPMPTYSNVKIVGYISFTQTVELQRDFFWDCPGRTSSFIGKGPFPLVGVETLEKFLADDMTERLPGCSPNSYNACDELAFRLKDRWIKAGLPPWSLNLVKVERSQFGIDMSWQNLFLTKENGQFVFYEVNARSDRITKLEGEPQMEYRFTYISGTL